MKQRALTSPCGCSQGFVFPAILTLVAILVCLVLSGRASVQALDVPVPIRADESLVEQFGYAPDYQCNVVTFDMANRPILRSRNASQNDTLFAGLLEGGIWRQSVLDDTLKWALPDFAGYMGAGGYASDRVVVDSSGRLYTVVTIRLAEGEFRNVLLYSQDRGISWGVALLPFGASQPYRDEANRGNVAIETPTGARTIDGPPFVAVWREIGDWPGSHASLNELYVVQPRWEDGAVVVPPAVFVSGRFIGMIQSAGATSFATSVGSKTYFTWAQVRDAPTKGTPTYVGVFDRVSRKVCARRCVAYGHPVNDSHCTPAMVIDSRGYLHVVVGAHGRPFRYTRSRRPLDVTEWTDDVKVLDSGFWTPTTDSDGEGRQTYASLVCGHDDTLHLVFRQARLSRTGLFPNVGYHALSYQKKPPGNPWSSARLLAYPAGGSGYTNYFQKLTTDRDGRLYLSFNFYRHRGVPKIYRVIRRFRLRMVWSSTDGGTWRFATSAAMAANSTVGEELADPASTLPTPLPLPTAAPALSDDEKEWALDVALQDDRLQAVLTPGGWWVEDVAEWTDEAQSVLGASVLVYFDTPVSIDALWPSWTVLPERGGAVGVVELPVQADDVKAVRVLVDGRESVVCEIAPYVYDTSASAEAQVGAEVLDGELGLDQAAMGLALDEARAGSALAEKPRGAVVVDQAGRVIARAHDQVVSRGDPTAHCGLLAVQRAAALRGPDLSGCTLVCTVEPCAMCFQAAWWARVSRAVYGASMGEVLVTAPAAFEELVIDSATLNGLAARRIELTGGVRRDECLELWRPPAL
jgi:tRNA(Arg) A34 adenosine deaminase TadA